MLRNESRTPAQAYTTNPSGKGRFFRAPQGTEAAIITRKPSRQFDQAVAQHNTQKVQCTCGKLHVKVPA